MGELDGVPAVLVMPSDRTLWAISMDGTRLVLERGADGSVRAWRGEYDWTRPERRGRPLGVAVLMADGESVTVWTGSASHLLRVDPAALGGWITMEE